jgi:phosphoribosylpyrophosphate synthetase
VVFLEPVRNQPERIVTFGAFLNVAETLDAHGRQRFVREGGESGYSVVEEREQDAAVRWTRLINALNKGRTWARERLFALLNEKIAEGIAVAVVPSHDPFRDTPPIRSLAQQLAAEKGRVDATGCLVRHTKIAKITFGGASYRSLHHQTIRVETAEAFVGRSVLLLDDIVKSGASLRACRELLLHHGATEVQMAALGRL